MSRKSAASALRDAAPVFAALGDPMRLSLVSRLTETGPMSITRLSDGASVTRQAVTKHLHVLAGAGIARSRRRGRESVWEIDATPLRTARRSLKAISRDWDAALDRLKAFVEEG